MRHNPITLPLLALACLLVGGCTTPVTIESWQASVKDYVWRQGNGDPNVLRNLTISTGQNGFSVIRDSAPEKSTDANGLLLSHQRIDGQPWFIYLVGLVRARSVEDIRLAAFSFRDGRGHWLITDENTQALEAYRQYKQAAWQSLFPDRATPPPSAMEFPGLEDTFTLTTENNQIHVRHNQSNAHWTLPIPKLNTLSAHAP